MSMAAAKDRFAKPSAEEAVALTRSITQMEMLRQLSDTMPLTWAQAFMSVALEPGLSVKEYADKLSIERPVMSRIFAALGPERPEAKSLGTYHKGINLIASAPNPQDLRGQMFFLTPAGKRFFKRLMTAVGVQSQGD